MRAGPWSRAAGRSDDDVLSRKKPLYSLSRLWREWRIVFVAIVKRGIDS
jgi:hypothetical protein